MAEEKVLLHDYPEMSLQQAQEQLKEPYPAWLLTPDATVAGANLLANWLWNAPQINNLLGLNATTIFAHNLQRLPKERNHGFLAKKIAAAKRLSEFYGIEPYAAFIAAMKADPELWDIYYWEPWLPDYEFETNRVWNYPIRIMAPARSGTSELLEFEGTVHRLSEEAGLFGQLKPSSELAKSLLEQERERIKQLEGTIDFVQYDKDLLSDILGVNDPSALRIRLTEEPLTALNLSATISALTELHTKSWLIQQSKFADLIDYTETHDPRFEIEANLIISKLVHHSPALIQFHFHGPRADRIAKAFQTMIDAVMHAKQRLKRVELENEEKTQEIKQKKEEADFVKKKLSWSLRSNAWN